MDQIQEQLMPDMRQMHQQQRFRPRTVFVPLLFLLVHWLAINVTATIYAFIYAFTHNDLINPLDFLTNVEKLTAMIGEHYPIISVIYSLVLLPVYSLYLYFQKRQDSRAVWLGRPGWRQILPALAVTLGLLGTINLWFIFLTWLGQTSSLLERLLQEYNEVAGSFGPTVGYFWLILGISILTPVAEELLFRGIIQGELRKAMPEWAAVLIQAVVFAAFHMQPIQVSYVLLPGLLLGLVYAWTRSLWLPIIMHVVFNFFGSVLPALIGTDEVLSQILGLTEMAFILVGGLWLIYLYKNRLQAAVNSSVEAEI